MTNNSQANVSGALDGTRRDPGSTLSPGNAGISRFCRIVGGALRAVEHVSTDNRVPARGRHGRWRLFTRRGRQRRAMNTQLAEVTGSGSMSCGTLVARCLCLIECEM